MYIHNKVLLFYAICLFCIKNIMESKSKILIKKKNFFFFAVLCCEGFY